MVEYSIKDLELLSGIKAHTLRIWEMRYGFISPERSTHNFRKYNQDHLKIVLVIAYLQKNGYKLSKLKSLSIEDLEKKARSFSTDIQKNDKRVLDMIIAYLDLNVPLFELFVQEYIQRSGIEKAINHLVIPFIERSKILYSFEGHRLFDIVIKNVVKNFFLSAITAHRVINRLRKIVVIFTPEENNDEVGLNYAYYSLYTKGLTVYSVGVVANFNVLKQLKEEKNIAAFVTMLSYQKKFSLEKFMYFFHQNIPDVPLIVLGTSTETYQGRVPKNIIIKKSISDAVKIFQ
ncbi:MerR family transcriptional regulator [Gynurincola endophyticus]|jgi:DNA-binding transcriptional MerR regulator|uniref:MerR family transcriptional regulator n=1 Tax=Gynurincola endophyticus TaxID=2479004 RepID=UPI000F8CA1A1|nr:MerR family transcriptional regulator [Gynurincola endophyticus]